MSKLDKSCELCEFCVSDSGVEFVNCHRFPPQFSAIDNRFYFPWVRTTYWCGEFKEEK